MGEGGGFQGSYMKLWEKKRYWRRGSEGEENKHPYRILKNIEREGTHTVTLIRHYQTDWWLSWNCQEVAGKGFPICSHKHNEVSGAHMVLSSQALSLRLLHSNQEVCTLGDPREGGRTGKEGEGGWEKGRKERREGRFTWHALYPCLSLFTYTPNEKKEVQRNFLLIAIRM